ncbi:MerR family transcriptional regulator [Enterococcus sp. LJL120]
MKNELTTGAFAKLCRISKRTLFYYDEIDLLKPVRVDEKGYRYYNLYQTDRLSTIRLFREIGLSLKEIQHYFQAADFKGKSQMLQAQQSKLTEKIQELQQISAGIDFLNRRFQHFQEIGANRLFIEELSTAENYRLTPRKPQEGISVNYLNYGYQYGIIFAEGEISKVQAQSSFQKNSLAAVELPQAMAVFQRAQTNSNFQKSAGEYVSIIYLLKNGEMTSCVPRFLKAIEDYPTTGPLFHEDYCSELASLSDEFIIKLSRKLQK